MPIPWAAGADVHLTDFASNIALAWWLSPLSRARCLLSVRRHYFLCCEGTWVIRITSISEWVREPATKFYCTWLRPCLTHCIRGTPYSEFFWLARRSQFFTLSQPAWAAQRWATIAWRLNSALCGPCFGSEVQNWTTFFSLCHASNRIKELPNCPWWKR